jgi:hypothetical protein
MDINKEYFSDKSEAEKLRNVSDLVNDIVNSKPDESLKVESEVGKGDGTEEELPEVNPLVDLVGKAISKGRPKGFFMQGVQTDDNPKL